MKSIYNNTLMSNITPTSFLVDTADQTEANERERRASSRLEQSIGISASSSYDAVRSRTKQVRFTRSPIHDWGVYSMDKVQKGDIIMEYVGEVVRDVLGDVREHHYERCGIESSYLFRLDASHIIDATKKGNIARFVNHSCDPNSYPRVYFSQGPPRIVIYAARDIEPGEEIVYDYKFPEEDIKLPCYCGSKKCRNFLN
jgi:histone-lysine N-methyltransferase SETD1